MHKQEMRSTPGECNFNLHEHISQNVSSNLEDLD